MDVLQAIRYQGRPRRSLAIIDQLQLPHRIVYENVDCSDAGWSAIRSMKTRGAPAIAIVAALSLAVELSNSRADVANDASAEVSFIQDRLTYLVSSRPTAVNLEDAARKLGQLVAQAADAENSSALSVREAYISAAERMMVDDVRDNEAIGAFGADWILQHVASTSSRGANIITHCNTGYESSVKHRTRLQSAEEKTDRTRSLATAGYGTALGIIRSLHTCGKLKHAYCTETRPYNQGSRLTAFELAHDDLPFTLITDSMAAALMLIRGKHESSTIDAIVVGADRVTANGDTANKIGTYSLAVLARRHGAKFIVAAPRTSIDLSTSSGDEIVIEQRLPEEVSQIRGLVIDEGHITDKVATISVAPLNIDIWNPSFDVTPAELVDAIITESGVIEKNAAGVFPLSAFLADK